MPRINLNTLFLLVIVTLGTALMPTVRAQETQFQYLSGHGKDDAVPWDFLCTAGRNAGRQTTIPVPSNWELQGFGTFSYGGAETACHPGALRPRVHGSQLMGRTADRSRL